jgi:uncharacterized protein (TIRG00374 family)
MKRFTSSVSIKSLSSSKIKSLATLAITTILLYLVIREVGLEELINTIKQADLLWVLVSASLSPWIISTGVIKWKILLDSQNISVPFWRLYGLYLVGKFFNNFLPSNVGGDLVRGYELGTYAMDGSAAMASIIVERLTGFIVLVSMAIVSFILQSQFVEDIRLISSMGFAVAGLVGLLWVILDSRPLNLVERWIKIPLIQEYIPTLQKFHASLNEYRNHKRALGYSLAWSVIFMILAITNVYVSSMAFHKPLSYWEIAIIVPIILVVSMIPITVNSLGLQEWTYVLLFTWIGLPGSVGLSAILLIRGKEFLLSVAGGLIYLYMKVPQWRDKDSVSDGRVKGPDSPQFTPRHKA